MSRIEEKLNSMGLVLPAPVVLPEGVRLPFAMVNVRGNRAFVSGHGPQNTDGTISGPYGKLGRDVSVDEGYELARKTGLSMLGSLQRELGDLDRVSGWCKVLGMVNSMPEFTGQPMVINGFSDLILEVFGPDVGRHSRSAVGMVSLPMGDGIAVEVEAEVLID